jgi:hypothetical protein
MTSAASLGRAERRVARSLVKSCESGGGDGVEVGFDGLGLGFFHGLDGNGAGARCLEIHTWI